MSLILFRRVSRDDKKYQELFKLREKVLSEMKRVIKSEDMDLVAALYAKEEDAHQLGISSSKRDSLRNYADSLDDEELGRRVFNASKRILLHLKELIHKFKTDPRYKILFIAYEIDFAVYPDYLKNLERYISRALQYSPSFSNSEKFFFDFEVQLRIAGIAYDYFEAYLDLSRHNSAAAESFSRVSQELEGKGSTTLLSKINKRLSRIRSNKDLAEGEWTLQKVKELYDLLFDAFEIEEYARPKVETTSDESIDGLYEFELHKNGEITQQRIKVNLERLNKSPNPIRVLVHEFVHFLQLVTALESREELTTHTLYNKLLTHGPGFERAIDTIENILI